MLFPLLLLCTACTTVAAPEVLLLPAAVRHRVPDDQIVAGSLNESNPSIFFSSFKRDLFCCTPWQTLAVLSHFRP